MAIKIAGTTVIDDNRELKNLAVPLSINQGGTNASTATQALTNLGAYPASNPNNYTSNTGTVTGVTGTAPIVSSGGTAPAISINAATTSAAGSMSATDKVKLDGIAAGAQVNVATNLAQGTRTTTAVPVTSSTGTTATLDAATTSLAGVMSSADKVKLDGIASGATNVTNTNQLTNGAGFITSSGTATNVSGTVAVANGGTGATTAANALTNLGAYPSSNPSGYTSNAGTVTSVGGTGTVSGLTLTGTVTTSGNLTLGGTLSLTSGQVTTALGFTPGTGDVTTTGTQNLTNKTFINPILDVSPSGTTFGRLGFGITGNLTYGDGAERIVVNTDKAQTLTNKTITGLKETRVVVAASNIDLLLGNYFTKTITTTTTFTVSNIPSSGTTISFVLELTNGGSSVVNWFSNVKWAAGTAPTLTASGVDILGFYTHDGGTTWRGMLLAKDSK